MLLTILIWFYTLAFLYLYGWFTIRLVFRLLGKSADTPTSFIITWTTGLCLVTALSSFFSIFIQISTLVHGFFLIGALAIFVIGRFINKTLRFPEIPRWKFLWILAGIAFLSVLESATHAPVNPDTGLYHAQAIRWIETFPAVPGLGNLQTRYAYNSSWLVVNAFFSLAFLGVRSFHLLGSVFYLVTIGYLLEGVSRLISGKGYISDLMKIALLPLLFIVQASEISSPGTDMPALLFTWLILLEWMDWIDDGRDISSPRALLLALFSVFIVTVKLSSVPLLIIPVVYVILLIRKKFSRHFVLFCGMGLLMLTPWFVRNVILSGYLVYPLPEVDLFNPDWKIPYENALWDRYTVTAWARLPGEDIPTAIALPFQGWAPGWFETLSLNRKIILLISLFGPPLSWMVALAFRKKYIPVFSYLSKYWLVSLVAYLGLIYWLFSAPDFRFGYGFLIFTLVFTLTPLVIWMRGCKIPSKRPVILGGIVLLLTLFQAAFLVRSIDYKTLSQRVLLPADYIHLATQKCQFYNVEINCAKQWGVCAYDPFPCVPKADPMVGLRGESVAEGFRYFGP